MALFFKSARLTAEVLAGSYEENLFSQSRKVAKKKARKEQPFCFSWHALRLDDRCIFDSSVSFGQARRAPAQ
jgi:hypothetical protein